MNEEYRYIGDLIKESRLTRNMNQEQLANIIGCSLNTVSRWENNHYIPAMRDIQAISKALNIQFSIYGDKVQIAFIQ